PLGVAVGAAGRDLVAAGERVPGRLGPLDGGVLAHAFFFRRTLTEGGVALFIPASSTVRTSMPRSRSPMTTAWSAASSSTYSRIWLMSGLPVRPQGVSPRRPRWPALDR